jgi:LPS-assembly lipoprotein
MRGFTMKYASRPKRASLPLLLCLLSVTLLLQGCGFHLQGSQQLTHTLANARLVARDSQTDFYSALRASLQRSGAQLDGPIEGAASIKIIDDEATEKVLTVSARNIPTAFLLSYKVQFSVEYQGREILPAESHTVTREFSFDETAVLAKEREREVLQQALADDLAALVMRRLATL